VGREKSTSGLKIWPIPVPDGFEVNVKNVIQGGIPEKFTIFARKKVHEKVRRM